MHICYDRAETDRPLPNSPISSKSVLGREKKKKKAVEGQEFVCGRFRAAVVFSKFRKSRQSLRAKLPAMLLPWLSPAWNESDTRSVLICRQNQSSFVVLCVPYWSTTNVLFTSPKSNVEADTVAPFCFMLFFLVLEKRSGVKRSLHVTSALLLTSEQRKRNRLEPWRPFGTKKKDRGCF